MNKDFNSVTIAIHMEMHYYCDIEGIFIYLSIQHT